MPLNESQAALSPRELETLRKQAEKYPDCNTCQKFLEDGQYFSPRHESSPGCRSGSRNHCTCSFCF